ncbi:DUF4144 family protein [Vibrio aestuarianus]|uniref:DUF4144 domain-containing protein n=1 Tax=Vibrio aestuarianus TaxID=28171 RepID=A0A9X4EZH9_9VIBR|nr:DUF4144 family protein [Vibrio aestuarianus]MDE1233311.1 DUF4144 domain-containing protein [Vibrio aestuarianus]MDE1244247.1 DUF4144 domain-containing protein [Vibrio aestuarianus]
MISWPCIFKLDGDSELMYLGSEALLKTELDDLIWDYSDRLIDSEGCCYVVKAEGDNYVFEPEGVQLSLFAVTQLIQEHEFSKAEVCLTKIQFSSIEEAIRALSVEM